MARELMNVLSVSLGLQSHLLGAMRDRVGVDNVTIRVVCMCILIASILPLFLIQCTLDYPDLAYPTL